MDKLDAHCIQSRIAHHATRPLSIAHVLIQTAAATRNTHCRCIGQVIRALARASEGLLGEIMGGAD